MSAARILLVILAAALAACGPSTRGASPPPPSGALQWGLLGVEVSASSHYVEPPRGAPGSSGPAREDVRSYEPSLAVDAQGRATAWCEGAEGPGTGETLRLRFQPPAVLGAVMVTPFADKDVATFARIKRLEIIANGKIAAASVGPDGAWAARTRDDRIHSIDVRIAEVEPGSGPLGCLADVRLSTPNGAPLRSVVVSSPQAMGRLLVDTLEIDQVLRTCDARRIEGRLIFPLQTDTGWISQIAPDYFSQSCHTAGVSGLQVSPDAAFGSLRQEEPDHVLLAATPPGAPNEVLWDLAWKDGRWQLDGKRMEARWQKARARANTPAQGAALTPSALPVSSASSDASIAWRLRLDMNGSRLAISPWLAAAPNGDLLTLAQGNLVLGARSYPGGPHILRVRPEGSLRSVIKAPIDVRAIAFPANGDLLLGGMHTVLIEAQRTKYGAPEKNMIAVARVSPEGAERWRFLPVDSTEWNEVLDIEVDPAGDVIIAGHFRGTLTLSPKHKLRAGYWDGFVAKLDGATGALKWANKLSSQDSAWTNLAVAPNGDVLVGGHSRGSSSAGGSPLPSGSIEKGRPTARVVLARYSGSDGKHLWSTAAEDRTRNVLAMHLAGDTLLVVRDYVSPSGAAQGGGVASRDGVGLLALSAADGSVRWSRWFGEAAPPSGTRVSPVEGINPATHVWSNRTNLAVDGSEIHIAIAAQGPLRHGAVALPKMGVDGRVLYTLSYSLDGEPRAARQIVAREMIDVGNASLVLVGGGDLALLGAFNRHSVGPLPRYPYDAFLMRIRRNTPSGATLVVE